MNLSTLFGLSKPPPKKNPNDLQVQGFISEVYNYLTQRLLAPNAKIVELSFLDRSTPQNSINATATIQLFFEQTIAQLESYKTVLNALNPTERMFVTGKQRTLMILDKIIIDCRAFEANAAYYTDRLHAEARKTFLDRTLKRYRDTLALYLEKN